MSDLTRAERSTVESIVDGVHRRNAKRRQAARSGWALLITAAVAIPVVGAQLSNAITARTALTRVGVALVLALFVTTALGSLFDAYQRQAAFSSVERAVIEARAVAAQAATAGSTGQSVDDGSTDGAAETGAGDDLGVPAGSTER